MTATMSAGEIEDYLYEVFPQILQGGSTRPYRVMQADGEGVQVRMACTRYTLRPGGTVSGPAMMALADSACYMLIFARLGRVPMAVTVNLNINFLRMPGAVDVIAQARFLKLGRRLAVMDVTLRQDGQNAPIAQATCTYSIPPAAKR